MDLLYLIITVWLCLCGVRAQLDCSVIFPKCYCQTKYTVFYHINCDNIGSQPQVPPFNSSTSVFERLEIRYDSRISKIQANAFRGLSIKAIFMRNLEIRSVDQDAFAGLGETLTELHLDDNFIDNVPSLVELVNLNYVALGNNRLAEVRPNSFEQLKELKYLYLSNNEIQQLDSDIFQSLTKLRGLHLQNNQIKSLPLGLFDSLESLWELELYSNMINELPIDIFKNLGDLEELTLHYNNISVLHEDTFSWQRNLIKLDLSHNSILSLPTKLFEYTTSLKTLYLSHNQISMLPPTIFSRLTKLRTLYIASNKIMTLSPDLFKNTQSITRLRLSDNKISEMDSKVFSPMQKLEDLNMASNEITSLLDGAFSNMSKVAVLSLANNGLSVIDDNVFNDLIDIETLDLAYNDITVVKTDYFQKLANLQVLHLDHNQISGIEVNSFREARQMNYLGLHYNKLSSLRPFLFETNLKFNTLQLSNNLFSDLDRDFFQGLGKLRKLVMDGNQIGELPGNVFKDMWELRSISLESNLIGTVHKDSFYELRDLEDLNLRNNSISSLADYCFEKQHGLITLDLRDNALTNLVSSNTFYNMKEIKEILLSGNEIKLMYEAVLDDIKDTLVSIELANNKILCDCDIAWLRSTDILSDLNEAACYYPGEVFGESVLCFSLPQSCDRSNSYETSGFCDNFVLKSTTPTTITSTTTTTTTTPTTTTETSTASETSTDSTTTTPTTTPTTSASTTEPPELDETTITETDLATTEFPYYKATDHSENENIIISTEETVDGLIVSWSARTDAPVTSFRLTHQFAGTGDPLSAITLPMSSRQYLITGLSAGKRYTICVEINVLNNDKNEVIRKCLDAQIKSSVQDTTIMTPDEGTDKPIIETSKHFSAEISSTPALSTRTTQPSSSVRTTTVQSSKASPTTKVPFFSTTTMKKPTDFFTSRVPQTLTTTAVSTVKSTTNTPTTTTAYPYSKATDHVGGDNIILYLVPSDTSVEVTWSVRTDQPVVNFRVTYRDTNSGDPAIIIPLPSSIRQYTIRGLAGDNTYIICVETVLVMDSGRKVFQGCDTLDIEAVVATSSTWLLYILVSAAAIVIILIFIVGCCMIQKRQSDTLSAYRAASVLSIHQAIADAEAGSMISDTTLRSGVKLPVIPVDSKLERKLPPNMRSTNLWDHGSLAASTESLSLNRSRENLYSRTNSREKLYSRKNEPDQLNALEDIPSEDLFDTVDSQSVIKGNSRAAPYSGVKKTLAQRKNNVYS